MQPGVARLGEDPVQFGLGLGGICNNAGASEGCGHGRQPLVRVGVVGRVLAQVGDDLGLAVTDLRQKQRERCPGGVGTPAETLFDERMGLLHRQRVGPQVSGRRDRLEQDRGEGCKR